MDRIKDQQDSDDILSVLAGNPDSFRSIVHRYKTPLYNLSLRMLGSREDAEEAVQEIFLLIFRKLDKYDGSKRFYSWMFTVALNYLRSVLRKSKKNNIIQEQNFDENFHVSEKSPNSESPEDSYVRKEAETAVQNALLLLPVKYREVFILREIQGFSVKDTADALNIPENSVKTLSRRGREKLKKNLLLLEWK